MRARHHGDLVLVVTDDVDLRRLLCDQLDEHGYRGVVADTGTRADELVAHLRPVVVIVDLDGSEGASAIKRMRAQGPAPVIAIGGIRESDQVALAAGAADHLAKPFEWKDLLARVRTALRRLRAEDIVEAVVGIGPIRIDTSRQRVTVRGRVVHVTPLEFRLLELLARSRGRALTREHLLHELWPGTPLHGDPLRIHVLALRRKLEEDPARPRWLLTVPRVGYRLGDRTPERSTVIRRA